MTLMRLRGARVASSVALNTARDRTQNWRYTKRGEWKRQHHTACMRSWSNNMVIFRNG